MTETNNLFSFSVYTMRNRQDLDFVMAGGGKAEFRENKSWATAHKLFEEAIADNLRMPIFFSVAEVKSGLIYFALLDEIIIENDGSTLYKFSELTQLPYAKPLSSLTLKSTGEKLSDRYIRPYAICKTPPELSSWLKESGLPVIKKKPMTGREPVHDNGNPIGPTLLEFWQWSASDLISNATRGILAEFLVASALGLTEGVRSEWDAYDLQLPSGHKIEVKSSAYIQSWYQRKLSQITFAIPETRAWSQHDNIQEKQPKRQADIYIFCLLAHKIQETLDPLDVSQWRFYVVPTSLLNQHCGHSKNIGLSGLKKIGVKSVTYRMLKKRVGYVVEKVVSSKR
ncbi:MAG: hypothetical protein R6U13_04600 [Desulfatiglandaceae bacterium]